MRVPIPGKALRDDSGTLWGRRAASSYRISRKRESGGGCGGFLIGLAWGTCFVLWEVVGWS